VVARRAIDKPTARTEKARVHELALMEGVVRAVEEQLPLTGAARVTRLRLEVGRLSAVVPDAMRFCFGVCARGTVLEEAALEILEVPGRARCRECGAEAELPDPLALCACGSADLELLAGMELRIKDVEVC
jgi:hydrogenase nickel incorporation protein HypA/HybF